MIQEHLVQAPNEQFTKAEFVRQYQVLSSSTNDKEKEAANQFILQFQSSQAVWKVANELILVPPSAELQCLGAQILCKKLKTHHSTLTNQQKVELKSFLFEVLNQYCQRGVQCIAKVAKNQIILSIAFLGFTGILTEWTTFVEDIIVFMQSNDSIEEYLLVGMEILENVANQESMEKLIQDMKVFYKIRSIFQIKAAQLSALFNALLVHQSSNVGMKALECIESWAGSQFKYQLFKEETLLSNLLLLLHSPDEKLFEQVAKTIFEGLKNSMSADILETASLKSCLNYLQLPEFSQLKKLIDVLVQRVDVFLISVPPESKFCKYFAELTTELASKFTILILEKSEYSQKLLKLMEICTQHPNRFISQITFDFWVSFFRTLQQQVPDIADTAQDWLIQPYVEIFKTVLEKSKLKKLENMGEKQQNNRKNNNSTNNDDQNNSLSEHKHHNFQLLKKYSLFPEGDESSWSTVQFGDFSFNQLKAEDIGYQNDSGDEDEDTTPLNLDLDQMDMEFARIKVQDYRIYARDIFNTVFNVLSQFRGRQGINYILQILYSKMDKQVFLAEASIADPNEATLQYCISVEVCLFIVQTMAENVFLEGQQQSEDNFGVFFEFIVNNKDFPEHQNTVKMAMQLFYNAQTELAKNTVLFDATIKFIFKYILDNNLGFMSAQTFSGIVKGVGPTDAIETFKFVGQFFIENLDKITRQDIMDELVQGVFVFALNIRREDHQLEAVRSLLLLMQQMLDGTKMNLENASNTTKKIETLLLRTVGILQSLLSGFSIEVLNASVRDCVAEFIGRNFIFLSAAFEALTTKASNSNVINQFISIFRYITKILSTSSSSGNNSSSQFLYEQQISFLNASIRISQRNPVGNQETMKIFKMMLDLAKTSSYSQLFEQWLKENFNAYNSFYLKFMKATTDDTHKPASISNRKQSTDNNSINFNLSQSPPSQSSFSLNSDFFSTLQHNESKPSSSAIHTTNKDPELIAFFYDIQLQVIKYFPAFYLSHDCFREIVEFSFEIVSNISQYEMARSILNFYYELIKYCSLAPGTSDILLRVLNITIDILPSVNSHLLHNISLLLIKFAEIFKDESQNLHEFILNCFLQKEKYAQFTPAQKKILTDCIVKFSLEHKNLHALKSLLSDLYQVYKEIFPPQEMFMNYELKLRGLSAQGQSSTTQIGLGNGNSNNNPKMSFQNNLNFDSETNNSLNLNFQNQFQANLISTNVIATKNAADLDDLFN